MKTAVTSLLATIAIAFTASAAPTLLVETAIQAMKHQPMKLISSTFACLLALSTLDLPSAWAAETGSADLVQEATVSQSPTPAPARADATRKPQIVIDAKFIETNAGKQDLLSAPRLTLIEGNKGTITVGRDLTVALPGAGKEATQTVQTGFNIEVTPFMQGDEILLRCNMTSTTVIGKSADTPTSVSVCTQSLSTAVVMLANPGKASRFGLGEEALEGKGERSLAVELTASIAKPEANAAPIYWQAFAAMPELSKEETALLALKPRDPLDKAAAEKLVAKFENSLALLATASAISECDWGVNLADGPTLQLPYLSKATELAKAARLRARLRLLEGNPGAAVSDLDASLRLARAAGQPGLLINLLVHISIERAATQTVAAHFGKFDKDALQQLAAAALEYHGRPSMKDAIEIEKQCFGGWMRRQVEQSKAKHETLAQALWIGEFLTTTSNAGAKAAKPKDEGVQALAGNWEGFERQISALEQDYDELARILGLPHAEVEPALAEFNKRWQENKSTRLLSFLALPAVVGCYNKQAQLVAETFMLKSAIEMQLDGRSKVLESRDPFGDGPFEVSETAGGIELKSKLIADKKPVTLTFVTK